MARIQTPDERAAALAARQHGALSHQQALAAGLSRRQIELRLAKRRWYGVALGVYVVAGAPNTWRQQAWIGSLASTSAGGLVSHTTLLALHALIEPERKPHVSVPRGQATRSGVAIVHRSTVPYIDRATVDGLRCTSVSRALVDVAGMLSGPEFDTVLDDALCRRLASPRSVLAAAARIGPGRRGLTRLRSLLQVWTEDIEPGSVAEVRLLRMLGELGVAGLVTQHEVRDDDGRLVARLDLAAPAERCAFEYDGRERHGPRRWERDEARYAALRALGWQVAAVSKLDLLPGEDRLVSILTAWAAGRAA